MNNIGVAAEERGINLGPENRLPRFSRGAKLVGITLLAALTAAAISAVQSPPAADYELTPFNQSNSLLGITLAMTLAASFVFALFFGVVSKRNGRHDWVLMYGIGLTSNVLLASIPIIRGYFFFGRDDLLTHLGYEKDLNSSGFLSGNVYPPTHILVWTFGKAMSIPPEAVFLLLPPLMTVFVSSWAYTSLRLVSKEPKVQAAVMALSLFLLRDTLIYPQNLAIFLLLLLVGIHASGLTFNRLPWTAVVVLLVVVIPFTHPAVAIVGILGFVSSEFFRIRGRLAAKKRGFSRRNQPFRLTGTTRSSSLGTVMLGTFLLWMWANFSFWQGNLLRVMQWLAGEAVGSTRTGEILDIFDVYGINFVEFGLILYGMYGLLLLLELFGYFRWHHKLSTAEDGRDVRMLAWLIPPVLLIVATAVTGALRLEPTRPLVLAAFAGFPLLVLVARPSTRAPASLTRKTTVLGIACLIGAAGAISSLAWYDPRISDIPNAQVTLKEMSGVHWIFESGFNPASIKEVNSRHFRLAQGVFGTEAAFRLGILQSYMTPDLQVPPHFGYDEHNWIAESSRQGSVIIVSTYDIVFNIELYSSLGRFNPSDFQRLQSDPTAALVYDNGGFTVYVITS